MLNRFQSLNLGIHSISSQLFVNLTYSNAFDVITKDSDAHFQVLLLPITLRNFLICFNIV